MPQYISKNGKWTELVPKTLAKEADELDITGDGKVDAQDASLAGKVLADAAKKAEPKAAPKKKAVRKTAKKK